MYAAHLSLHDFRSWASLELELEPGVTSLIGRNGQGKTNIVEALDYLSRLRSHRVAADAPLVRQGADQAIVRAAVIRDERRAVLEVEINPGRSNRARINRGPLPKARELLGLVRTVLFAPDDLALVKGDPAQRRAFLDDLLTLRTPRHAALSADYERVLKQRNTLLKSARAQGGRNSESVLATLEVWDAKLASLGAEIVAARARVIGELGPHLGVAYAAVARGATRDDAVIAYRPSVELPSVELSSVSAAEGGAAIEAAFLAQLLERRRDEFDRALTLVGPHRDELVCTLGALPVKGYASHGESWSFALGLRLASYELLRAEGDDPILILDDVFAELDSGRREQLAELVVGAEQVLVTAAVAEDVPKALQGRRFLVREGQVSADD